MMRRRATEPPEDSVTMRVVVALAVQVGVVAVVTQGAVDAAAAAGALILAPVGYWFSYRRRHASGVVVKLLLALGLLAALWQFLATVNLLAGVDAARVPLASLFLWVQVLHAFDVPRRRDLAFSMVSSTTLVAAAGALALTSGFAWVVLAWAVLAAAWLWSSGQPRPDQVTAPLSIARVRGERRTRLAAPRSAVAAGLATILAGLVVFSFLPRLPATLVRSPPAAPAPGGDAAPAPAQGVANPSLPSPGDDGVVDFAPDGYPGFSSAMDLRARGQLSNEIAFRVRATQPALWRAESFDTFDGSIWRPSTDAEQQLGVAPDRLGYTVPDADELAVRLDWGYSTEVVQTFYIDSEQPNVVFAAADAETVFFPSGGLRVNDQGAIRSPILLEEGLVYSVISRVPSISVEALEVLPVPDTTDPALQRYLQLPPAMPARVTALARQIVRGSDTQIEATLRVQSWLRSNTSYDLGVPREPAGADAVDHFLFETRRGFCEHIASAMAVMLRSVGVPARLAVGYGPGERNPLTGYFEVAYADAHAWVEVWFPGTGWLPFDPTFGVPAADPSLASQLLGVEMAAAIGRTLRRVVPEPVKAAAGAVWSMALAAAGSVADAWPVAVAVVLTAGAAVVLVVASGRRGRRRRGGHGPPDDAGRAFEELVAALRSAGHERSPSETPRELLAAVVGDERLPDEVHGYATVVVRTFERARFAAPGGRPALEELDRARAAASAVKRFARTR